MNHERERKSVSTETVSWVGLALAGGRYQVTAKLGEGGMGFVYRARDRHLDNEVVIKVPRPSMLEDAEFAHRFAREIRSLVRLAHPHIVKVTDVGEHEGIPFAVMDYLSGGSLRSRQERDAEGNHLPMPEEKLSDWLPGVAQALDYIHHQGYIHRDVKPDNILFDAHGHVYLSDFGVAKVLADRSESQSKTMHTAAGMILGTPQYMAPELIMGQRYDGRVDQYALAVMLYELLSSRYPFDGPTAPSVFVLHTTQQPEPLDKVLAGISPVISEAVYRGLAKDPKQRFADCGTFARAVLAGVSGASGRPAAAAPADASRATIVKCPACHKSFSLPPGAGGKRLRCTACGEKFQAPAEPAPRPATVRETVAEAVRTQPAQVEAERTRPAAPAQSAAPAVPRSPEPTTPAAAPSASGWNLRHVIGILAGGLFTVLVAAAIVVLALNRDAPSDGPQPEVAHAQPAKPPAPPAKQEDPVPSQPEPPPSELPAPTPPVPTGPPRLLPMAAVRLHPGEKTSVPVRIERNGLTGAVMVEVMGLPPGVTAQPVRVPADQSDGAFELSAAATAKAADKEAQVRAALGETIVEGSLRITLRRLASLTLAPLADVTIEPGDQYVLEVQVERKGCEGPINVQVTGLPAQVTAGPAQIAADQNSARVELSAALNAETVERPALVVATLEEVSAERPLQVTVRAPGSFSFGKHLFAVNSVAFSPDGKYAASGSDDETVAVWDLKTGKEIRRLKDRATGVIRSVIYTPDGGQILCAGDSMRLRLWSVRTGAESDRFAGHTGWVYSAVLSKDGLYALSGSEDKTIRLWDVATGQELRRLIAPNAVGCVALSPDRRIVLSASRSSPTSATGSGGGDARVSVWEMSTGKVARRLEGHTRPVQSIAFAPDGRRALTGGMDQTIRLWDVTTGQAVRRFTGHEGAVTCVVFSPDGRRALSGSTDLSVRLWDVDTGRELRRLQGHGRPVTSVAFAPDGRRALSGSADHTLRLWQLPR